MGTTPEEKKRRIADDLTRARREVIDAALALNADQQDVPFLGTWSAHDIVAHLVGWDHANLEALDAVRAGHLPAFYAHHDRDWATFNAGLVAEHKQAMLAETVARAQASHRALLEGLAAVPAEEVGRDFGVRSPGRRRVTMSMLLTVEARDERKHAAQIRAFATSLAGRDPAAMA